MSEKRSGSALRWYGAVVAVLVAALMSFGLGAAAQAAPGPSAQQVANTQLAQAKKDYCGGSGISKWVPDHWFKADFGPACESHDRCYSHTSTTDRLTCDKGLLTNLRDRCMYAYSSGAKAQACFAVAKTYYEAVRKFAKSHYHGSGNPK
ncbi:hypothetical protein GCM10022222_29220 [Amycolatopsis ultiminotia]|uniref:Phospholipase A2 n=1 Tax=Amycolatopsis ultiminotia TaxID=543629 RepID=A0ABP6VYZ8_9PSEU